MWKEFKEFATKGNVIDLAIGVIIGGGFQKVVNSLVNDMVMPIVSIFAGRIDFNDLAITLGNSSIKYGSFLTNIVNFLIVAFSVFVMIRYINKLNKKLESTAKGLNEKLEKQPRFFKNRKKKHQQEEKLTEPTTKLCSYCMTEIHIKATRCPHCTSVIEEL